MFVAGSITAQVVIRERVEVDPEGMGVTSPSPPTANTVFDGCGEGSARGFTVAVDGILKVRLDGGYFSRTYLSTQRDDVTVFTLGVNTDQGSSYSLSPPFVEVARFSTRYRYYFDPYAPSAPERTLGVVEAGEEVVPYGFALHGAGSVTIPAPCYPGAPPVLDVDDDVVISLFCCAGPAGQETFYLSDHFYVLATEGLQGLVVQATPDEVGAGEISVVSVEGLELDGTVAALPGGSTIDLALDTGGGAIGYLRRDDTSVEGLALSAVPIEVV